mgnify:CR=1 FL=1
MLQLDMKDFWGEKKFMLNRNGENSFQKILISKDSWDKKNQSLSFLMTQLERFYNIEILEKFTTEEQKNSREFKLYVKIAHSRK